MAAKMIWNGSRWVQEGVVQKSVKDTGTPRMNPVLKFLGIGIVIFFTVGVTARVLDIGGAQAREKQANIDASRAERAAACQQQADNINKGYRPNAKMLRSACS